MKVNKALILSIFLLATATGYAQISLKTEYLGKSSYWLEKKNKEPRERVGNAEGSAMVYQGSLNIPLSLKENKDKKPIVWGLGLSGSYVSLKNENFTEDLVISEILNVDVGIYHKRPISQNCTDIRLIGEQQKLYDRYKTSCGSQTGIFHLY